MKQCGIRGTIEAFVTEPNGKKSLVQRVTNTVAPAFLERLAQNLVTDRDIVLNNLFVANTQPPTTGQAGIAFYDPDSELWYSMITTTAHPTATTVVVTGTFTGTAVKVNRLMFGIGWLSLGTIHGFVDPTGEGGVAMAVSAGTAWVETSYGAAQTLTVNWTFEVL